MVSPPTTPTTPTNSAGTRTDSADPVTNVATVADEAPGFAPMHRTVGYGLLRLMTLEERPNSRDVVIYARLLAEEVMPAFR